MIIIMIIILNKDEFNNFNEIEKNKRDSIFNNNYDKNGDNNTKIYY